MVFQRDDDYIEVADRIACFAARYPEGSLQPVDPLNPYRIEEIGGKVVITYAAAAYRTPDDLRPGIGVASEPYPGTTPYTKNSELQNAETSAWGRAIVALGLAANKRIASANEVRNREAERSSAVQVIGPDEYDELVALADAHGVDARRLAAGVAKAGHDGPVSTLPRNMLAKVRRSLEKTTPPAHDPVHRAASEERQQRPASPARMPENGADSEIATPHPTTAADAENGESCDEPPGMDAEAFRESNGGRSVARPATNLQIRLVGVVWRKLMDAGATEAELRAMLPEGKASRKELTFDEASGLIDHCQIVLEERKAGVA